VSGTSCSSAVVAVAFRYCRDNPSVELTGLHCHP